MKVLYYFPELSNPMYQWQRTHFIDELSHYGIEIQTFNPLIYKSFDQANEEIVNVAKNGAYDLFFTCLCNEKHLYIESIKEIKRLGIPTLSFRPDNLSIPYNDKVLSPYFDLVWLTARETKPLYDKWGAKTVFAPYAANPLRYNFKDSGLDRTVSFIGTPHGSRPLVINTLSGNGVPIDAYYGGGTHIEEGLHQDVIKPLCSLPTVNNRSIKLQLRTTGGRKLLLSSYLSKFMGEVSVINTDNYRHHLGLSFDDMVSVYNKSALSLSFSSYGLTDILKHPLPVVNLRNFEIPMCGGIQLCRYSDEMAGYFTEDKEVVLYRDKEEMIDKAKYYIYKAKDSELLSMKQAARLKAESEHTWKKRFDVMFNELGLRY